MPSCVSCGIQVAESDAFCPVCQQPVPTPAAGESQDELETTVIAPNFAAPPLSATREPTQPKINPPAPPPADTVTESKEKLLGRALASRYRLLSKLGQGGMGAVYKCIHIKMNRPTAIKVLKAELANNPEFVSRFEREAEMASRIGHPNAVTIYDAGEAEDGTLYIAMEYLDGVPLSSVLKKEGPLPLGRALGITAQAAEALEAAHQLDIVHRDFKPDNIMICKGSKQIDRVKVVDFGIAKRTHVDPQYSSLTKTGYLLGTPQYMSPEQVSDDPLDPRSDLYSLGLVTYEMLTGRLPFEGTTPQSLMAKRLYEAPLPLKRAKPDLDVPPAVEDIIIKALARDRNERFRSVKEFVEALEAAARPGEGESQAKELNDGFNARETRGRRARRGLLIGLGSMAAIMSAIIVAVVLLRGSVKPAGSSDNDAARLERAVADSRLVTLADDDAYTYFVRLREADPTNKALGQVADRVLPQLQKMGDEIFRRKASTELQKLTDLDWAKTVRIYQWACLLKPADKSLEARRIFAEAEFAKVHDKLDEAERGYYAAIQVDGSWALPQNSLGLLRSEKKRYSDAVNYFLRAIRLQPDWEVPYNNLGAAYLNMKNYPTSEIWFHKALDINPRWARPHLGLGAVYENRGDIQKATTEYKTAIELDPNGAVIDVAAVQSKINQIGNK